MVCFNTASGVHEGLEANWHAIKAQLLPELVNTAVFFISETRHPDGAGLRELARRKEGYNTQFEGAKLLLCGRDPPPMSAAHPATHDGRWSTTHGGIAAMTFNKNVRMQMLRYLALGAIAVELTVDGYDPIVVLHVYNPPAGSPLNRGGHGQRATDTLLARLRKWKRELAGKYKTIIMCGDWNMRPGRHKNRRTTDARPPSGARTAVIRNFMNSEGLQVLHGSPGQVAGHMTSRVITDDTAEGSSEVDFFLVDAAPHAEAAALEALPQQVLFSSLHGTPMTHVPVAALAHLRATGQRRAHYLPARAAMLRLPYGDRRHHAAAAGVLAAFTTAAALTTAGSPASDAYIELPPDLLRAADTAYKHADDHDDDHNGRPRRGFQPSHEEELRLRCAKNSADKAEQDQQYAVWRLYAADADANTIAEAEELLAQRHRERAVAMRALRSYFRQVLALRLRKLIKRMEWLRSRDPTAFFREAETITSEDLVTFPNASRSVSMADLVAHYSVALKENPARRPDALDNEEWMHNVPQAPPGSGMCLMRKVLWWEVYLILFPADKRLLHYIEPCCDGCILCKNYIERLKAYDWNDPSRPAPDWMPHLNTCRAAGPDGVIAELLCFTRPLEHRFEWRKQLSEALATIMDAWLREGVPSTAGFREVQISAPAKPLRPGAEPPANPAANTRPISVSVVLAKVFELLVSARAEHWRVASNLVGPEQAAFMQYQSAEMHVLTLRESLLWRRAQGKGTNVIFVDFKAAYDSVHQELLWKVLLHMGVPAELIAVLRPWYASRTGRIKADGKLSEPFPINKGVPQGGPLSTLLWNLFIESLSRRLRELPGVTVGPGPADAEHTRHALQLKHLLFADDLAILTEPNSAATQEALRVVAEWGVAFGVRVNDGAGKTEAMHFAADVAEARAAADTLAPLTYTTSDGQHLSIKWVHAYKYLGAQLQLDLDAGATLQKRLSLLDATIARYFTNNRAISELAVSTQLQLLSTVAVGAINYLLAILPVPASLAKQVDARIIKVAHRILGLPEKALNALIQLQVPGHPFYATCVMHQLRLLEYLRLSPLPNCLAACLVRLQQVCGPGGSRRANARYVPFARRVENEVQLLRGAVGPRDAVRDARAAPWDPPANVYDIHNAVAVARRAVACRKAYAALGKPPNERQTRTYTAETPIPAALSGDCVRALYYGGRFCTPASLGRVPYATPLSITGPGCGGSLLSVCTLNWRYTAAVIRLLLGRKAYAFAPWSGAHDAAGELWDGAAQYADGGIAERIRRYASRDATPCPHCDPYRRLGTDSCPRHVMLECQHGDLVVLRGQLTASAPDLLLRLLGQIHSALERAGQPLTRRTMDDQTVELRALLDGANWASQDGKHVLFHLLTALPWPAAAATPRTPLSAWLGRLFDATLLQRRHRRAIADTVIRWASHWIKRFAAKRWQLLNEAHALEAAAAAPPRAHRP